MRLDKPKYMPVMPIDVAEHVVPKLPADISYLLIGSDILKYPDRYAALYKHIAGDIIVDNSVIEDNIPSDIDTTLQAANVVNASIVVLPDVLMDAKATVDVTKEALGWLKRNWDDNTLQCKNYKYMLVPQATGLGIYTWIGCLADILTYMELENIRFVNWIGIARNVMDQAGVSRDTCAFHINNMMPGEVDIHLLGFSENLTDDLVTLRNHENVMSIDSAEPVRFAYQVGKSYRIGSDVPPRGDWWNNSQDRDVYWSDHHASAISGVDHYNELMGKL